MSVNSITICGDKRVGLVAGSSGEKEEANDLYLAAPLNFEDLYNSHVLYQEASFDVSVVVTDKGYPLRTPTEDGYDVDKDIPQSTLITVHVVVLDVNEPPVFDAALLYVPEHSPQGHVVAAA